MKWLPLILLLAGCATHRNAKMVRVELPETTASPGPSPALAETEVILRPDRTTFELSSPPSRMDDTLFKRISDFNK